MFSSIASGFCCSVPASLPWSILQLWISNDMDPKLVSLQHDTAAQDADCGPYSHRRTASHNPLASISCPARHCYVPRCIEVPLHPRSERGTCFEPLTIRTLWLLRFLSLCHRLMFWSGRGNMKSHLGAGSHNYGTKTSKCITRLKENHCGKHGACEICISLSFRFHEVDKWTIEGKENFKRELINEPKILYQIFFYLSIMTIGKIIGLIFGKFAFVIIYRNGQLNSMILFKLLVVQCCSLKYLKQNKDQLFLK